MYLFFLSSMKAIQQERGRHASYALDPYIGPLRLRTCSSTANRPGCAEAALSRDLAHPESEQDSRSSQGVHWPRSERSHPPPATTLKQFWPACVCHRNQPVSSRRDRRIPPGICRQKTRASIVHGPRSWKSCCRSSCPTSKGSL